MSIANLAKEAEFLKLIEQRKFSANEAGQIFNAKGKELCTSPKRNTVLTATINGKAVSILAKRFVWIYFNGLVKDPAKCIAYKDTNTMSRALSNLYLADSNADTLYVSTTRAKLRNRGKSPYFFTDEQVIAIRTEHSNSDETASSLSAKYKISKAAMSDLLTGITYRHLNELAPLRERSDKTSMVMRFLSFHMFKKDVPIPKIAKAFDVRYSTVRDRITGYPEPMYDSHYAEIKKQMKRSDVKKYMLETPAPIALLPQAM